MESVTTWIKKFFNKFDEKAIAKKLVYVYRKKGIKTTATKIRKEWKKSRDEGTLVHKEMQEYIEQNKFPKSEKGKQGAYTYHKIFGKLTKPTVFAEHIIYSEKLGLAGTIDVVLFEYDKGKYRR